jgi:dTDP-4-amino-4,6-dideoxygalactose transaminase
VEGLLRVPFLDLPAQYREAAPVLDPWVQEILASGAYVLGRHNQALEREIAELHGVAHGIAVNSGTDALRIAMQACDIGPGDEVITTAFTFVASIEAIVQLGATPVLVDIDPATFNIDPVLAGAAVTSRTKAILPIHLFGQLADMEALGNVADKHGLMIIEDAAQSIGSHHRGRYAGAFGRATALSFYVTKNLGAAGDGGMVLTGDHEVERRAKSLRIHGMGRERYYYDEAGYTSRMAEIQAAVLRAKLTRLLDWSARREAIASTYNRELADCGLTLPATAPGNHHTWHQYTVRSAARDDMQAYLRGREIDSMVYYPVPLHFHEPYRRFTPEHGLPETERAAREVLSLPVHPHMTMDQVYWVAESVRAFCGAVPA